MGTRSQTEHQALPARMKGGLKALLSACLITSWLVPAAPAQQNTGMTPAQALQQAQTLSASGDYTGATGLLAQSLAAAERPQTKLALLLRLADYQQRMQLDARSLASLEQARQIAETAQLPFEAARFQNEIAALYHRQGRYEAALAALRPAVERYRQLKASKGYTENGLARALLLQTRIHTALGDSQQAIEAGNASLAAMDHANDKHFLSEQLLVMADVMYLKGGFVGKKAYVELALQQAVSGQVLPMQVAALTAMSQLYNSWGQPEEALLKLQEAISLAQVADPAQARSLGLQRGEIQTALGQHEAARTEFAQVRAQLATEPDRFLRGRQYLRLGQGHAALGDAGLAASDFEAADTLFEALSLPYQRAQAQYGLAELDRGAGRYAAAIGRYQQALQALVNIEDKAQLTYVYGGLGLAQLDSGQTDAAIVSLQEAVKHGRALYGQAGEAMEMDFFEKLVPIHQALIRAYFQAGRIKEALEQIEEGRALRFRQLLQKGNSEREAKFGEDEWKPWSYGLAPAHAILVYGEPDAASLLEFRVRYNFARKQYPFEPDHQEGLSFNSEHYLRAHPLFRKHSAALGLEGQGALLPRLCQVYRQLLSNPESDPGVIAALSSLLYNMLIAPHEAQLEGIHELTIVPSGELGLIPYETLRDAQGKYLLERFNIRYIQSVEVLSQIEGRNYPASRAPMLVVGDPVYQPLSYEREPIESAQQLYELKKLIQTYPTSSMREAYAALYSPQWEALPGTRAEVAGIEKAVAGSRVVTGEAAAEGDIKALAAAGELGSYKVLHFAMHGLAVPEIPELSALVLSQFSDAKGEDGYLRLPEIAALPLRADFVNLSACETGVGKVFKGEGVFGLAQAFLSAGANQVAVSLWQISDAGSAEFMQALYREPGPDYGSAMRQVKQRFIAGDFGATYQHPYYWSPFVVYGKH